MLLNRSSQSSLLWVKVPRKDISNWYDGAEQNRSFMRLYNMACFFNEETLTPEGYASVKTLSSFYEVSVSTIWRWTASQRLPAPVSLGENCTRWRWSDIYEHKKNTTTQEWSCFRHKTKQLNKLLRVFVVAKALCISILSRPIGSVI